jgi:hypothetical protein
MNRPAKRLVLIILLGLLGCSAASIDRSTIAVENDTADAINQDPAGRTQLDPSKPVPEKSEILPAWRKRETTIKTFQFNWTEQQTHPQGWLPNPRYPQREWLNIPGLQTDRSYTVSKTLAVADNKMRYSFELDRKEEADGVRVVSPQGDRQGLGVRRNYSYVSVFDGHTARIRLTSLLESPPETDQRVTWNVDAQNLDLRPILLAFRPFDPAMGDLLIDRAVTNRMRTIYRGKSTFILEERHDPSGWKTMMWLEPERNFLVSRYVVLFEQKWFLDIDIDYALDQQWGWIPTAWHISELVADGSRRLVSDAKVTSYTINQPTKTETFQSP